MDFGQVFIDQRISRLIVTRNLSKIAYEPWMRILLAMSFHFKPGGKKQNYPASMKGKP